MQVYRSMAHSQVATAGTALYRVGSTPVVDPKQQSKADNELAKAARELAKGDSESDSGKPGNAIKHYEKAYCHAEKVVKLAGKIA